MMNRRHVRLTLGAMFALMLLGGCPGDVTVDLGDGTSLRIPLPSNTVRIEVFNDTGFEVDPRIRFDDDSNFLAAAFPAEELSMGILLPGELIEFEFDCDQLGLIFSDTAGQFFFDETIGQADETRVLQRGEDYDCGDVIQFQFLGEGPGFGVVVSVNGRVVD